MNPELRSYLESIGLAATAQGRDAFRFMYGLKGEQRSKAESLRRRKQAAPQAPPTQPSEGNRNAPLTDADRDQIRREGATAEIQRRQTIDSYRTARTPDELYTRAINEGWDPDRAATQFLLAERDRTPPVGGAPAIHSRSHDGDCSRDVMAAALMLRHNIALDRDIYQRHQAVAMGLPAWATRGANDADSNRVMDIAHRYRDLSAVDLCREALRLDGRSIPTSRQETIRSAVSGSSLSYIFTTSVLAQLLSSYTESPDTTMGWVREADVPNFKSNDRIQLGKTGSLEKIGRGDTAKHATISDSQESYKIARYAKKFVVDEQDIIDDDLMAIMDMPMEMGMAAARLRPDLVYAILLANPTMRDGNSLFDNTNHANAATSAALAADKLRDALEAMAIQQQDGVNLGLFATRILCPHALKFTARVLTTSQERRDTTTSTEYGTRNVLVDENLSVVADSRLDNGVTDPSTGTAYSGSSTTWYLAASGGRHTIEVGYRVGTGRAPVVRSFVLTEGQWGLGWDINMDIGAKALDWRGFYRNVQ